MTKNNKTKDEAAENAPASSRRKLVLGAVFFGLALMFLVSFIYRSQNQGLQVHRQAPEHGDAPQANAGQQGMPPQMNDAMMGDIGKLMQRMQETPDDVNLLLELADKFMVMKSWERAEMFLNRAMVIEPSNPFVLYNLGIAAFQQDRPEDASQYFEQLIAVDPNHAHAHFNLGMLYSHFLNKPEKGKAEFEKVLELPNVPEDLRHGAAEELGRPHEPQPDAGAASGEGAGDAAGDDAGSQKTMPPAGAGS